MTPRKARIMFEMHLPIVMLAQIGLNKKGCNKVRIINLKFFKNIYFPFYFQKETKKGFQKGLVTLKLALQV